MRRTAATMSIACLALACSQSHARQEASAGAGADVAVAEGAGMGPAQAGSQADLPQAQAGEDLPQAQQDEPAPASPAMLERTEDAREPASPQAGASEQASEPDPACAPGESCDAAANEASAPGAASAPNVDDCTAVELPPVPYPSAGPAECSAAHIPAGLTYGGNAGYRVRVLKTEPAAPTKYENAWTFELLDAACQPLDDTVSVEVRPFMPAHGHDGTYAPELYRLDAPGRFVAERINLWMSGWWEVQFRLEAPDGELDYIVAEVCVE